MIKREMNEAVSDKPLFGTRILYVDDDPIAAELLRVILVREGADVTVIASAEAAIPLLRSERFDLLLSDLSMPPGLDGYDLVHALRRMEESDSSREEMPAVAVSGDAHRPSKKRRFADFQVYMPKPVNAKRLLDIVERLLEAKGEVVKNGSLSLWEAKLATEAAEAATDAATMAIEAAHLATGAAQAATAAARKAEETAARASSKAPRW